MTFREQIRHADIVHLPGSVEDFDVEPECHVGGARAASPHATQLDSPGLFDQVQVTATFTFRPLASDSDPDLMALWLSEDADVQAATLIEFTVDGVAYSRDRYGHWEQVEA